MLIRLRLRNSGLYHLHSKEFIYSSRPKKNLLKEFPAGQWLGLQVLTAEDPGSVPGRGTKIPQDMQPKNIFWESYHQENKGLLI